MARNDEFLIRIQRLEAADEIRALIAAYGQGADAGNSTDIMMPLFTDDVVWDGGERFGRYEGNAAVREFLLGSYKFIRWTAHFMISPVIKVSDDAKSASASWYLWELAEMPNTNSGELEAQWIAGIYHSDLRKQGKRWKFARLKLDVRLLSRYREGWAHE